MSGTGDGFSFLDQLSCDRCSVGSTSGLAERYPAQWPTTWGAKRDPEQIGERQRRQFIHGQR